MSIQIACGVCGRPSDKDRCSDHRRKDHRPSAAQRGYDAQHRKDRERYLARHPVCEELNCSAPSTVLDHIDGLGPKGPRGHEEDNWRALCASCHGRRTARDQPGGWNAT